MTPHRKGLALGGGWRGEHPSSALKSHPARRGRWAGRGWGWPSRGGLAFPGGLVARDWNRMGGRVLEWAGVCGGVVKKNQGCVEGANQTWEVREEGRG